MSRLLGNAADYNEGRRCGKLALAMRFLSLQSHVASGYVAWRGRTAPADQVADIVHGIEALGLRAKCDALLTGYVGDAALADVVLDTARKVRAANPKAVWCCDPVLGDVDTGIYVK